MGKSWENHAQHGKTMGKSWKTWENHENIVKLLGKPWENHGKFMDLIMTNTWIPFNKMADFTFNCGEFVGFNGFYPLLRDTLWQTQTSSVRYRT